ncbi:MAG: DNA translocase FtsK 4TM domain-containing protein, partial [Pseudomonadota bacterium]
MAFFSRADEAEDAFEDDLREPLLPATWSEALRRRGMELLGLGLLAVAAVLALSLGSYDPADPSFFNATSDSPGNWLGLPGATLADPLARTLGLSAWMLPGLAGAWALRFVLHAGEGRVWSRLLAMPPAVLAVSGALAAHVPPAGWAHPYGLGGLLGDGIGRAALEAAPAAAAAGALPLSLGLSAIALALGLLAAGIDRAEIGRATAWMAAGSAWALRGAGRSGVRGLSRLAHRLAKPRSSKLAAPEPIGAARREAEPEGAALYEAEEGDPPLTRGGAEPSEPEPEREAGAPREAPAAPASVLERLRGAVG